MPPPTDIKLHVTVKRSKSVNRALSIAPLAFEEEMADALDHANKKFFKVFNEKTRLEGRSRRWQRTIQGYTNRKAKRLSALNYSLNTYSEAIAVHEEGGTIRHPGGKELVVPIKGSRAMTKTGLTSRRFYKKTPIVLESGKASYKLDWRGLKEFKNIFRRGNILYEKPLKTKAGNKRTKIKGVKVADMPAGSDRPVPIFRLVKSFTLQERLKFIATWDSLEGWRDERFDKAAEKAVKKMEKA